MRLTLPQGGAFACVYIRITMVIGHVHVPPCDKISPVNIKNGRQSWTDIKVSSAGGIPLIIMCTCPSGLYCNGT